MAINDFFRNLTIGDDDDDIDDEFDASEDYMDSEDDAPVQKSVKKAGKARKNSDNKVVPIPSHQDDKLGLNVHVIIPKNINNNAQLMPGRALSDILKSGSTVLINLENVNVDVSQRILDFISGVVYYSGSNMTQVSQSVYVCTPSDINISGTAASELDRMGDSYQSESSYSGYNNYTNNNGNYY
jgi:cell division inhibitor SepF